MFKRRRSELGAVSVFLIMVFAVVFAFVSIFVDFARISALQAKTEMLAHAAARSVMSAYDPQLLEKYGLFAFGETDANYMMSKVLQAQFDTLKQSESLPIVNAQLDSSSVELLRPLGTYGVFEQQIREQMKYKAPIDFTIEIINRFKPMSGMMKEASNTVDLLGKLQKLYERREAKLDDMLEKQTRAAAPVTKFGIWLPRSGGPAGDGELGDISAAADVAAQYGEYAQKVAEDRDRKPLKRRHTLEIGRYRSKASRVFDHLKDGNREAGELHRELLPQAKQLLNEARDINEQMKRIIKEAEDRPAQDGYNTVANAESTGGNDALSGGDHIYNIRQKSLELILPEDMFADFESDISQQAADYSKLDAAASPFLAMEGAVMAAACSEGALFSNLNRMRSEVNGFAGKFADPGAGNLLEQNRKKLLDNRSSDGERKATEKKAAAKLKEARNLIGQISGLKEKLREQQKQFDQLEAYFQANREFNSHSSPSKGETGAARAADPYDAGGEAMAGMDSLYGGFSGLLQGMTDSCFQTEYIASYFRYLDVSSLKGLLKEKGAGKLELISDSFAAGRQEVEYILYGFHNPAGNIAAAYGEIFTLRLAIRTMEGLVKHASEGNPLFILASALLYGVENAIKDMIDLTQKGSLELSDFLKIQFSYRDHLRLFLLIHGRSEKRLSRMLAVIRMNTGIPTEERATYLKGSVTASSPLWFLPGVAKAMSSAGVLSGRVEGSKYVASKQADFSY
ncbi:MULTISPECIES: hypothetical protein [Paenibacillus]|uniref:TadE/TadG family type IV pilus assembly protein n=1 Tax=Paenibacillus TaxID=44249 RepID=UPI002FE25454